MRRDTITRGQIIELTREVLHGFYGRKVEHLIHYLSDDFVWIGAFDYQFATNKEEFLNIIQSELNSIAFTMEDEHFQIIARDRDTFVLCSKFKLTSPLENGETLQMSTRLTIIWKYIENELKLIHIHGSNAQDIPITIENQLSHNESSSDDFINYITNTASTKNVSNKLFRLSEGGHKILAEDDILYLKSSGQNTLVVTKNGDYLVAGILRTHQAVLSDIFFRIHKSYLVNTSYISSFKRYIVVFHDGTQLPLSKEKYINFRQVFQTK